MIFHFCPICPVHVGFYDQQPLTPVLAHGRLLLFTAASVVMWMGLLIIRKTSSISRIKFQNLIVICPLLQLSLPNPLKPGVKLRIKM